MSSAIDSRLYRKWELSVQNQGSAGKPFGRPRDADVHGAILEAALDLFIEAGLDRLTFEKVAARAGTTRAAIYRRWDSKVAMVVEAIGRLREQSEASIGPQDHLKLEDVVAWLLTTVPAALAEDRNTRLLARLIGTVPDHPELVRTYREIYLGPRRQLFNQVLEEAKSRGALSAQADVEILQDMFASAMLSRLYMNDLSNSETTRVWMERLFVQLGWLDPSHRQAPPQQSRRRRKTAGSDGEPTAKQNRRRFHAGG